MLKIAYSEILGKSWKWTIKNKILWIFGIFIGGGGAIYNIPTREDTEALQGFSFNEAMGNLGVSLSEPGVIAMVIGLALLGIALVLIGFWANASILIGLSKVKAGSPVKFVELFKSGFNKIGRILLMEILFGILNLVFLVLGLIFVFAREGGTIWIGIVIVTVLMIIYNLLIFVFRHYSYCFAVLENEKAWSSIKKGWQLFRANIGALLVVKLMEIALWIGISIGVIVALLILVIPFILLGLILSFTAGPVGLTIAVTLGIILILLALLILRGAVNTFMRSYLTHVYWQAKGN
ncbi:hypothetical protein HQ571_03020 [Candidatus Kuenenbacteria bacterium]|nr:hypothetical protein [Candidatus Kuenenbacteria bacterium]